MKEYSNFLDYEAAAKATEELSASSTPFSLIRIGDGENSIIQYPEFSTDTRIQYVFRRALGDRVYKEDEILSIKHLLERAMINADVLGIYSSSHPDVLCRVYSEHLHNIYLPATQILCHPSIHFYLQERGFLARIIESRERVTIIAGRGVVDALRMRYPLVEVDQITVPSEYDFRLKGEEVIKPHLPERFNEVMDLIRPTGQRHLFLIGAGFLGKIYADTVKRRGGQAIDIGSVFDYWAGIPTREGYKSIVDGNLALRRETARKNSSLDAPALSVGEARNRHPQGFAEMKISASPNSMCGNYRSERLQGLAYAARTFCRADTPELFDSSLGAIVSFLIEAGHSDVDCAGSLELAASIAKIKDFLELKGRTNHVSILGHASSRNVVVSGHIGDFADQLEQAAQKGVERVFLCDSRLYLLSPSRASIDAKWVFEDLKLTTATRSGTVSALLVVRNAIL